MKFLQFNHKGTYVAKVTNSTVELLLDLSQVPLQSTLPWFLIQHSNLPFITYISYWSHLSVSLKNRQDLERTLRHRGEETVSNVKCSVLFLGMRSIVWWDKLIGESSLWAAQGRCLSDDRRSRITYRTSTFYYLSTFVSSAAHALICTGFIYCLICVNRQSSPLVICRVQHIMMTHPLNKVHL